MLSVLVLALCLLISGGISEDEADEKSPTAGVLAKRLRQLYCLGLFSTIPRQILNFKTIKTRGSLLQAIESFLMTYRNFNTNPTGENTTSCVTATMIYKDEATHYVLHNVSYLNTTTNETISFNKSYDVISSECYTTRNVLNGTVAFTNKSELYPFAFADKNCAVIRKDSWSNGKKHQNSG
uniref:Putative secreted salivary protein n=1 Tax=Ixodes scapularis TaxID=6945 RepID=Q4PN43_IXOSC|nr:putative secreted salivary protein [Ixodes scapularis]